MLENEDRNSSNCCENNNIPDIAINNYSFFKNNVEEDSCEDKKTDRKEMLQNIRSLSFAVIELAQYLDTHPDDIKAIKLHNEYTEKLHDLKENYQMLFGPLTINFPCNKWRWLEGPWPWERGNI